MVNSQRTRDMSITESKNWRYFHTLNRWFMNFMGYWFFISFIGIVILLDWILAPEIKSIQDEGIYVGYIIVSLPLAAISTFIYVQTMHFILWLSFRKCYDLLF